MVPILSSEQIREADAYTIKQEPIPSYLLMERASKAFVECFLKVYRKKSLIKVFAGVGNNGGDGLAIARMLSARGYIVDVYVIGDPSKGSEDFTTNLDKLPVNPSFLKKEQKLPPIEKKDIIIDGIFGSGLSRPVEGFYAEVIEYINRSGADIVSIDIASGLYADRLPGDGAIIEPSTTISFQFPKLVFFQPDLGKYIGDFHIVDIGLDKKFIEKQVTNFFYLLKEDITEKIPVRRKYAHKGDSGRLRIVAGSKGKMGAAVMASNAALRVGVGLLFVQVPEFGVPILQQSVSEAMVIADAGEEFVKEINVGNEDVVGLGPGLDTKANTVKAIKKFLSSIDNKQKLVFDADAINILALNPELIEKLPEGTILTPHPGEFKRLAGDWEDDFHKLELLRNFCTRYKLNIVLKGAHSAICNEEGKIYFNSTGNPGMATGGSGDVLFGMICGLFSQKLDAWDALVTGVYLHGLAGDLASAELTENAMIASDIIRFLPGAFREVMNI